MDETPAQAEAEEGGTTEIAWDGFTVEMPSSLNDIDLDALVALETGRSALALKSILGPAYSKLQADYKAKHGRGLKVGDLNSLLDVIAVHYGFKSAGE